MNWSFFIVLSLLTGCSSADIKPVAFPNKYVKEGPGLFSGEKGYFEIIGNSTDTQDKKQVENKELIVENNNNQMVKPDLNYEASH